MRTVEIDSLPFSLDLLMNEYTKLSLKKKWGSIKTLTLYSESPFDLLAKTLNSSEMEVQYNKIFDAEGTILFSCSALRETIKNGVESHITGNFYALQKMPFLYLITGERNPFLPKVLAYIAKNLYPTAIRTFVTSDDLLQLLTDFSETKQIELRYTEFVYKNMFEKAFTDRRNEKREDRGQYERFSTAFRKAREQGARVDRIKVFGKDVSFSISRSGVLKIFLGNFTDYYQFFISRMGNIAIERWKIFEKRARAESPNKQVRPVLVNFDSNVFENVAERKLLIRILADYKNCEYSVIHGGNPHVYVAILDKIDNSSFTVRTYENNSLILIPQIRTTKSSLVRFSKFLLDKFQEGIPAEFQL
jgi:hypothetical protein